MPPRPRYHNNRYWVPDSGDDVRWAVRTLAAAIGAETHHNEWWNPSWYRSQRRTGPRRGPRQFHGPPRGAFQRRPDPWQWRPYFPGNERYPGSVQQEAPRTHRQNWRPRMRPRRGPPVAAIKAPRRYHHGEWEKRQPHGSNPGGTQRGGPERPADDPRRTPQGGLRGGPGRSAKEPQTPPKPSRGKTNGGMAREGEPKPRRLTVTTVEMNGQERTWGPLSRSSAWRVGSFWDEMKGKVKDFPWKKTGREKRSKWN